MQATAEHAITSFRPACSDQRAHAIRFRDRADRPPSDQLRHRGELGSHQPGALRGARRFADANGFAARPGKCLTLPAPDGGIAQVLFGLEEVASKSLDPFRPGALPGLLPAGLYRFANAPHDT